jgi:hypothetical protein
MIENLTKITLDYNKATEYLTKGNVKRALPMLKKVLAEYPCKEAYVNIGNCYKALGQDKDMIRCYKLALEDKVPFLDPNSGTDLHALNNLGLAYYMYGDDTRAVDTYMKAIMRKGDFWEAHWNLSTALLRQASSGKLDVFPPAWEEYRARFLKNPPIKLKNTREGLNYWDRVSPGKDIVVLTEQGIGDNIMFGRYLSLLAEKFERVFVQCHPSLEVLFSDYECVRDAVDISSSDLVAYPICSLGECFSDIPSGDWLRGKFSVRDIGPGFNVGIVWAGSPTHANDRYRSTSVGRFKRLANFCNLYSLAPGAIVPPYVRSLDIGSWTDTAECINGLDLVISVDTSVVHLAGSLGARTWVLQPYKETDFRWGNGVRRSVWYNDVEIYDNPQSWEYVFDCVEKDLRELVYA